MAIAVYQRMITPRLAHSMNLTGQNDTGNLMDSTVQKVVRGTQTFVLIHGCTLTGCDKAHEIVQVVNCDTIPLFYAEAVRRVFPEQCRGARERRAEESGAQ